MVLVSNVGLLRFAVDVVQRSALSDDWNGDDRSGTRRMAEAW